MWTANLEAATPATPEAVWDALTVLHAGSALGPSSDPAEPLMAEPMVMITPDGVMRSVVTQVEPGRMYSDHSDG